MKPLHASPRRAAQDKELRQRATKRLQLDGPMPAIALPGNPQRMLHELQVYQVELEMQNEQLEAARAWIEAALASYTELFDFAPVPYFTLDHAGKMVEINLAGARLLGIERARLLDKRLGAFVSMADRGHFAHCLKTVFATHSGTRCEIELVVKDGSRRTVEVRATMSNRDENCRAVLIDISERSARERQLAQLSEVFSLAREGMYLCDHEGRIVAANHALCDLTGYGQAQLLGQMETVLRSQDKQEGLDAIIMHALLFKGSWTGPVRYKHRDGSESLMTQKISTMLNGQGATIRVSVVTPLPA